MLSGTQHQTITMENAKKLPVEEKSISMTGGRAGRRPLGNLDEKIVSKKETPRRNGGRRSI